jgi:hypothetical protein
MPDGAALRREPIHVLVGRQVRRLRLERCWTTQQVAAQLDFPEEVVSAHEAGTRPFAVHELAGYTRLFGVSVAVFFRDPSHDHEVIPFPRASRRIHNAATVAPGLTRKSDSEPERATTHPSDGIVAATVALSTACRNLEASLSALIAQCSTADKVLGNIGDSATTIATSADVIGPHAAEGRRLAQQAMIAATKS